MLLQNPSENALVPCHLNLKSKLQSEVMSQYESIQIRVNRDPNDTILLLFQPLCTQPRLLHNIEYQICNRKRMQAERLFS